MLNAACIQSKDNRKIGTALYLGNATKAKATNREDSGDKLIAPLSAMWIMPIPYRSKLLVAVQVQLWLRQNIQKRYDRKIALDSIRC